MNSNGYVALGTMFRRRKPGSLNRLFNKRKLKKAQRKGFALFTPLWVDSNLREQGSVFIHTYEKTDTTSSGIAYDRIQHVLALCNSDVAKYGGLNNFDATFVMVVTWDSMVPRKSYHSSIDKVCGFHLLSRLCHYSVQ